MQIRTEAIVVKQIALGDNDKLLTVITKELGKITVLSKGSRSLKSKLSSSSQLFAYSKMELFKNKDKYILDSAEIKDIFFELRNELSKLSLAQYLAELSSFITYENSDCEWLLRLLCNCLHTLCKTNKNIYLVKAVFELRALSMAGYMPDLSECVHCNDGDSMYFMLKDGSLTCSKCSKLEASFVSLPPSQLNALRYIIRSDNGKLFSFTMSDEGLKLLSATTERYAIQQLEHHFSTLDFFKSVSD